MKKPYEDYEQLPLFIRKASFRYEKKSNNNNLLSSKIHNTNSYPVKWFGKPIF